MPYQTEQSITLVAVAAALVAAVAAFCCNLLLLLLLLLLRLWLLLSWLSCELPTSAKLLRRTVYLPEQ